MISIDNYISERLILSKNKKNDINDDFNVFDSSYTGKLQLSNNCKLEFHRIFNKKYKIICCTETWIEGIKESYTTVIVQDDVYDYLLQFVHDYDPDWGFGIVGADEKLWKQLYMILDECDNLYVTSFEKWLETRKRLLIPQLNTNQTKIFNAFTEHIEKDLR